MSTIIGTSTITDSTGATPGAAFTPSGDFFVTCLKGNVRLEVQIDANWFGVAFGNAEYTRVPWIKQGNLIRVTILEAGATYRLVGQPGQVTTASAYNL